MPLRCQQSSVWHSITPTFTPILRLQYNATWWYKTERMLTGIIILYTVGSQLCKRWSSEDLLYGHIFEGQYPDGLRTNVFRPAYILNIFFYVYLHYLVLTYFLLLRASRTARLFSLVSSFASRSCRLVITSITQQSKLN